MHVTLRVIDEVGNLRELRRASAVREAFVSATAAAREDFRLVHFTVQPNHLHLIVEAADREALARGVKGLEVRVARRLNTLLGRRGAVFVDRYHARPLTTPRETRNALRYVLLNSARHGGTPVRALDPLTSSRYFDGWHTPPPPPPEEEPPVSPPQSWLLRIGWKHWGPLSPADVPKGR